MSYSEIIENIRKATTPFEILNSVDNFKWKLEQETYKNRKLPNYRGLRKCIKS